jgi:hypothetical protein
MDEQERQRRWHQAIKSIRLMAATIAVILPLALLTPVIANHASPLLLLLAVGPAALWAVTWTWEGRPPANWPANPERVDKGVARMERFWRRHLLIGLGLGIPSVLLAIFLASHH